MLDASRSVPVAQALLDPKNQQEFVDDIRWVNFQGLHVCGALSPGLCVTLYL